MSVRMSSHQEEHRLPVRQLFRLSLQTCPSATNCTSMSSSSEQRRVITQPANITCQGVLLLANILCGSQTVEVLSSQVAPGSHDVYILSIVAC